MRDEWIQRGIEVQVKPFSDIRVSRTTPIVQPEGHIVLIEQLLGQKALKLAHLWCNFFIFRYCFFRLGCFHTYIILYRCVSHLRTKLIINTDKSCNLDNPANKFEDKSFSISLLLAIRPDK